MRAYPPSIRRYLAGPETRGHHGHAEAEPLASGASPQAIPSAKKKTPRLKIKNSRVWEKSPWLKNLAVLRPIKSVTDNTRPKTAALPLNRVKFRFFFGQMCVFWAFFFREPLEGR